ncbi:MAG TPA: hypothetical protein VN493_15820 [Thermoanaerobaculia bacterium]|nr:hypothetical protein [Thermoanaerobaculia bacterium]
MKPTMKKKILTACLALIAFAVCGQAAAQNLPTSDLLLPYFEVDPDAAGVTTLFAVGNATDKPVEVIGTVHTNWGIPILKVPFTLQAREVRTVNLRDWFHNGGDPGKKLAALELDHLAAAASGQRSPKDNLYYSTEVRPDVEAGYVTLRTQGKRPDALWGDWFFVDVGGNLARGDVLVNIDRSLGCPGLCQRHLLRYLSGGGFDGGTDVIIWRETLGQPSSNPEGGIRLQTDATAFSEPGVAIENRQVSLLPVEKLTIAELGLKEPFGSLDIESEAETFVAVQHSAELRYSVGLTTYCLPRELHVGPGIEIVKLTNGVDANQPPGPSIPAGSPVTWEYKVTNAGDVELTGITVKDDKGVKVSCPDDRLAPGESMVCTGSGTAQACQYTNLGTVTGFPPAGPDVSASDPSHYFGEEGAELTLAVLLNGQPAGSSPGPKVTPGSQLNWSFEITNTGKVRLTGIQIEGVSETCPGSALDPGKSMTCTAKSTAATSGQSIEVVEVVASGQGSCSSASAAGTGFYASESPPGPPGIKIVKLTNDQDVAAAPGPALAVGSPVTWKYLVTNTGEVALNDVKVTDDKGVAVSCPKTSLGKGESMTCTGQGTAQACQYTNQGKATGTAATGVPLEATDTSWYFGLTYPAIKIKKATNGDDADAPPGPQIKAGSPVLWTYLVTNTGDVALSNVAVTDNKGVAVSCPKTSLNPGESMTCTGNGTATIGQYQNIGAVTGKSICGQTVSDDDPSHYYGIDEPGITIVKLTNGQDVSSPPGPQIEAGAPVTWSYVVTNTGKITLTGVAVTDDQGVAVTCPKTTLKPGESMTCTGKGTAKACQYQNLGTANGTAYGGQKVSASDPSWYFGKTYPAIDVETKINGDDADSPKGPEVPSGSSLSFTYIVKNTGDSTLTGIQVTDSKGVAVSCPKTSLTAGESMTCTANGTAQTGQYSAVGAANGQGACGQQVSDSDPVHYYGKGEDPKIKIVKLTNGQDANTAPGPEIAVGSTVTWQYQVTNTGNVALSNVKVTDDKGVAVSCPKTSLSVGETMTCTGSGKAQACQYANIGTATGKSPAGQTVSASDPSHYYGKTNPKIEVEAKINGDHADTPKGPELPVGSKVTFTYWVRNEGDVTLTNIQVTDSKGVAVTCPKTSLNAGDSMFCTGTGTVQSGQYSATATATGLGSCGQSVSDDDPVHYYGKGSHHKDEGCSHGYWKNHTSSWSGYSTSQKVNTVFSQSSQYPSVAFETLHESLAFSGGSDLTGAARNLLKQATASLLNAAHSGIDFPMSTAQVISDVNSALASKDRDDILDLAEDLDDANNLGCPLD